MISSCFPQADGIPWVRNVKLNGLEMTQELGAFAAPAKDLGLDPSTHMIAHTHVYLRFQASHAFF